MNSGTILGFATPSSAASGVVPMPIDSRVIASSTTYTALVKGTLLIRAIAADGSAGVSLGGCATGAGAGEAADKVVQVNAGDEFVISIGAGGPSLTRTTGHANGNDGGDTTVTGPGVALTVKGGKAGKAAAVSAGTALLGGDGGSGGSGGDFHRPGGRAGNIANCNFSHATGGGAVNFSTVQTQEVTRGGDVLGTPTGANRTGGGGVRGRGGDATSQAVINTSGGGSNGNALDNVTSSAGNGGPNHIGSRLAGAVTLLSAAGDPFGLDFAAGNGSSSSNNAGPGGGGAGSSAFGDAVNTPGGFGGFGGAAGTAGVVFATAAPLYGAPGGNVFTSGTMVSLKGRDGVVFIRLYPRS